MNDTKLTPTMNCVACSLYWTCKRSEKKLGQGCSLFQSVSQAINQDKSTHSHVEKEIDSPKVKKSYYKKKSVIDDITNKATADYAQTPLDDYSNYFDPKAYGLKLPEDDFPLAKNLYEFVFSKKFLNLGENGLYARQFGIGLNLFMEYCPKCSDVPYVVNNFEVQDTIAKILERVTLFEHGVCPKCKTRKQELINQRQYWDHYELAALCGQRSGKSLMAAIFSCYVLHRFLKLPDISEAFDVAKPTILLGTFVALDKSQIQDSTWGYLFNLIKNTPWFVSYCSMLREQGRRLGRKLVDVEKVETIEFFHKNLKLNMAAPRPGALRGRTGFIGVIDEIAFLKTKDGDGRVVTADDVYDALNNRMATLTTSFESRCNIVPNLPSPLFMNISSPSHVKDKICTLVKGIKEQGEIVPDLRTQRRYAVTYATWDINPKLSRDSSYIVSKFASAPKETERDFGATPPLSANAFIEQMALLLKASQSERSNLLTIDYTHGDKDTVYKIKYLRTDFDKSLPRVLALDLGYNNNSTAMSIGYYDEVNHKVVTEALIEIIPTAEAEIRFTQLLANIIKPLIAALNIRIVASDRWQSINFMQEIQETTQATPVTYSLKYGDFIFYKQTLLNEGNIFPRIEDYNLLTPKQVEEYPKAYFDKPVTHFFYQCLTVVDEKDKTVRKGDKTTDDLFRANVLLHYILTNLEHRNTLKRPTMSNLPVGSVVHVQSIRGATGAGNNQTKYASANVVVV